MGDNTAQRAAALMAEAKNKQNSFGWFSNNKFDEAAELFKKAANNYKLAKLWDQAADAYAQAITCYQKLNSNHDIYSCYVEAASCYKKTNPKAAIDNLIKAIDFLAEDGRFSMAAKYKKEIAELCETDGNFPMAIQYFQESGELYEAENSISHANACFLKVAHIAATLEDYNNAIKVFEETATKSMNNNLLKWSAKDYLFKAGLCRLCAGDLVSARKGLDSYPGIDPNFVAQREFKFLESLYNDLNDNDLNKFDNDVADFESINKSDAWKSTLIGRIKNLIKEDDFR